MLARLTKDKKLRHNFLKKEKAVKTNKFLFIQVFGKNLNSNLISKEAKLIFLKRYSSNQSFSKTQFTNRCIDSNRSRGVLRTHSVSRIRLREYIQFGILPGYRKSVW